MGYQRELEDALVHEMIFLRGKIFELYDDDETDPTQVGLLVSVYKAQIESYDRILKEVTK